MHITNKHFVNGNPLQGPFAEHLQQAVFGLGCFWGAERCFWQIDGVFSTAAGYAGGKIPDPDYGIVCSGNSGHAEVVQIVFDPATVGFQDLLTVFWEGHDPTQGMQQGNDLGTQYRSVIYTMNDAQTVQAQASLQSYQAKLTAAERGQITTQIEALDTFYYAEDYHQQYLAKNPGGYCGLGGTGVACG